VFKAKSARKVMREGTTIAVIAAQCELTEFGKNDILLKLQIRWL
jgi:hypothetical protein